MNNIANFAIEKTVTELCKKHDWNIEVKTSERYRFFTPKEDQNRQFEDGIWRDTSFKVTLLGEYQGVEFTFYNLGMAGDYFAWQEVGISYNIEISEGNFSSVAQLMAMTPVMLQSLKNGLNKWAGAVGREIDVILDSKEHGETKETLLAKVMERKAKIEARNPDLAPYYTDGPELEIQEFVLRNIWSDLV